MTKWTITLHAASREEDTKVVKILASLAKLGLQNFAIASKEIHVETETSIIKELAKQKTEYKCKDCGKETTNKDVMREHRAKEHGNQHYS